METIKKPSTINSRIPVIKEEVAPEITWITFQLAAQIESDFDKMGEKCKQITDSIHHFRTLVKSINVSKYDGTDYQRIMEQIEMDFGTLLLKQCLDGLVDMDASISEARHSLRQSAKKSRMNTIKILPPEKEIGEGK